MSSVEVRGTREKLYAVVTAGGLVPAPFARTIKTEVKALAPLGGRFLIDPVVDAARDAGVEGIAVVGPAAVGAHCGDRIDRFIASAPSAKENIRRALRAFPQADRIVFLTSDLPFIEGVGLRAFIASSSGYGLTMALAGAKAYTDRFPGAPRHLVRMRDAWYANGSVFAIDHRALDALEGVAGRFFAARKSLPRLAALLGLRLSLRFALGTLDIADVERRAQEVLGIRARAIRDADPGLCFDIDDVADWQYACRVAAVYG